MKSLDNYPFNFQQGFTRSIPHFGRVLKEGLAGYAERITKGRRNADRAGDEDKIVFYTAMEHVLAGVNSLHKRILKKFDSSAKENIVKNKLRRAFKRVPGSPAKTFYEALVATNFIFYVDGCDNLGRLDLALGGYYEKDLRVGRIRHEEAVELINLLWQNFNDNFGWNVALGGSKPDGSPAYNELTAVCLEAARKMRRPNLALKIRKDMPEKFFDAALDTIRTGCGIPAFYNEELYLRALRENHLNINHRDICDYAFEGCTETMIHGKSNVGSLDGSINLTEIFVESLGKSLVGSPGFETLLDACKKDLKNAIEEMAEQINLSQKLKAQYLPQVIRSLFIDDCIDAGVEYNAGGARYNWSVVNVGGLANVADSLVAIKKLVYDEKKVSTDTFWKALNDNFEHTGTLQSDIKSCPRYGNDLDEVDGIAEEISSFVFKEIMRHACWRGGHFLPACLMFVTYAGEGEKVMATPDGRKAKEPIADSIGPYQGRDNNGPTAMLKSVAKLNHRAAAGTLVLNIRLARTFFDDERARKAVKDLIRTYFKLGGMQIQITVVDQKILRDAIANPEKYEDLIVRIGGYSEYFNRLTPTLKETVLARTEYSPG